MCHITLRYFKTLMTKVSLPMIAFNEFQSIPGKLWYFPPGAHHVHQWFLSFWLLCIIYNISFCWRTLSWTCTPHISLPQISERKDVTFPSCFFWKTGQVELRLGLVQCHLRADTVRAPWRLTSQGPWGGQRGATKIPRFLPVIVFSFRWCQKKTCSLTT